MAAVLPCPACEAHRRNSFRRYGAWFCEPKLPGERGGQGELNPGLGVAGESPRGPLHGRRPWSSPELAETGPREHRNAWKKAEKVDEDEARSPTRRRRTKTARTADFARKPRRRFTGVFGEFLRGQGESRAGERGENVEKRGGSLAGLFK